MKNYFLAVFSRVFPISTIFSIIVLMISVRILNFRQIEHLQKIENLEQKIYQLKQEY
jgi:membrane protein insertase Oxa1/YidC/SpoIIIJ